MARKFGNGRLEEAIAFLINNQSTFVSNQSSFLEQIAQLTARIDERFSRIESELAEIKSILLRHEHMLQALPEAVLERIGFAPPNP